MNKKILSIVGISFCMLGLSACNHLGWNSSSNNRHHPVSSNHHHALKNAHLHDHKGDAYRAAHHSKQNNSIQKAHRQHHFSHNSQKHVDKHYHN